MISIPFSLKSLKDLKGNLFISFINPKKLKMLDHPFGQWARGSKQALRRISINKQSILVWKKF
jgi:hypothetical protein